MTDDRDNSVSSCLFRIVDLMLHISFKDIVMCSILKVLTLHFFLSHTGFWTTQPLYCIRFVAAWKHKSFCLFFIAPVVYVKVSFLAIFYHSLVFLSCIFFQHEESIPYCLGFYILVRGESMCCSSFFPRLPVQVFFQSKSIKKKKREYFITHVCHISPANLITPPVLSYLW